MDSSVCFYREQILMEKVCRVCLSMLFPVKNIFETCIATGDPVYKVLNYVFALEITLNDSLPHNICQPCLSKVTDFFYSKRKALFANSQSLGILGELRNDNVEIEEWKASTDLLLFHDSMKIPLVLNNEENSQNSAVRSEDVNITKEIMKEETLEEDCIDEQIQDQLTTEVLGKVCDNSGRDLSSEMKDVSLSMLQKEEEDVNVLLMDNQKVEYFHQRKRTSFRTNSNHRGGSVEVMHGGKRDIDPESKRKSKAKEQTEQKNDEVEVQENISCPFQNTSQQSGGSARDFRNCTMGEPFPRDNCDKKVSNSHNSEKYISKCTAEKVFSCTMCNYQSNIASNVGKHMQIHAGEKNSGEFKCNLCAYRCSKPSDLTKHVHIHIGDNPFKCNLCAYRFTKYSDLRTHIQRHVRKKPFKCNSCAYRCDSAESFRIHQEIHPVKKPFKCYICNCSFAKADTFRLHMKIHSGEKLSQ